MTKYKYTVLDPVGKRKRGVVEGTSATSVRNELLGQQLDVINVSERKSWAQIEITRQKIKPEDVMNFSRQLGAFLRAGIPVLEALDALSMDSTNKQLKQVIVEVSDSLRAGSNFSDAVAEHSEVFPSYYVGILRSAELTGNLDVVLRQLAEYIERDLTVRRTVRSAMIYPMVIIVMALFTVTVLVAYVLPKFETFFENFDADLPLATRILLSVSDFFQQWWPVMLGVGAFVFFAGLLYFRTARGQMSRDRLLLRLPIVGDVVQFAVVERFCRVLSTMTRAGVPIADAMTAATVATNNRVYEAGLQRAREEMLKGEGISRPIAESKLFPGAAAQMMRVGEQSGTLDDQLDIAADFYESELQHKLKKITSLFEPAVIVFMGLIVGFVAIALVSAMYGIFDQVELK